MSELLGCMLLATGALALFLIFSRGRKPSFNTSSPYAGKPLLTAWERRGLLSLRAQVPVGFYVCPQVRLIDMLTVAGGHVEAFNQVVFKSADFAIIHLETGRVALTSGEGAEIALLRAHVVRLRGGAHPRSTSSAARRQRVEAAPLRSRRRRLALASCDLAGRRSGWHRLAVTRGDSRLISGNH